MRFEIKITLTRNGFDPGELEPNTGFRTVGDCTSKRPRILLAEDVEGIRDILVPMFFQAGFDCREAANGGAAIDLLASRMRIDLVFSCLLLPVVDGFTLLLHVKKNYPRIPFVFYTGVDLPEVREGAMKEGADGFVVKPSNRDEILGAIRKALRFPVPTPFLG